MEAGSTKAPTAIYRSRAGTTGCGKDPTSFVRKWGHDPNNKKNMYLDPSRGVLAGGDCGVGASSQVTPLKVLVLVVC